MPDLQALFDAARSACNAGTWSRGVEAARADAIAVEHEGDGEIVALVGESGSLVPFRVTLYPDDADWECNCPGADPICHHVAAAAIAIRRAHREGRDLPSRESLGGRIRYEFFRVERGLELQRSVVTRSAERRLETTLVAIASGRVGGPDFVASPADLDVEHALGSRYRGRVLPETMKKLFEPLSRCPDVRLDDVPVRVSTEALGLTAILEDAPEGFLLRVARDESIAEAFDNGAALRGNTLHPLLRGRLSGRELEELPRGRHYTNDAVIELVTEVLPDLRQRLPVEIRTRRLPSQIEAMPPRIEVKVERRGDRLEVLPTLVYGQPAIARIDGDRLVPLGDRLPIRDREAERRCRQGLREDLGLEPGRRASYEASEAITVSQRLEGMAIKGDAHRSFYRTDPLEPQLKVSDTSFEIAFGGDDGGERVPAQRVLSAWREGERLVPLATGGFAPLPLDWLGRHGDRIARILAARGERGGTAIPPLAQPELARLCDDLGVQRPAFLDALAPLVDGFEGLPPAPLPEGLQTELRNYQARGVDWLCFLRDAGLGGLLADDMGLGKTLQALCSLRGRCLVVAPTSVLPTWQNEIARHRPDLDTCLYHGSARRLDPDADITLTSYALLRLDAETLAEVAWDAVVLDEAQAIKNPDSQAAAAARSLNAGFRLALTGTPVENRLDDLWSQFAFLAPGLLGTRREFRDRSALPIADGDAIALADLHQQLRPFLLRRLKREVAPELPPRIEVIEYIDLEPPERELYDSLLAATRSDVVEQLAKGGSVLAALEALLRLRQAACCGDLVPGQQFETSSKIEVLSEKAYEIAAEGQKALIFSQWTSLLDRIEPALTRRELAFTRLDGSTRDRGAVVDAFQSETGPPFLLISLRAGGTGLNLTAADHVFLVDPWWNPAVEDQAADRAHRIGQDHPVMIHRLVARKTVEEGILELQQAKRRLAEAALTGAGAAAALSREDLLALLQ